MRTRLMVMVAAVLAALVVAVWADPPTAITSYFAGTKITPADFADAGTTGLVVSNMYVCIPLAALTNTEYTAALVTNDVRPFASALLENLRTAIAGMASTNQFDSYTISKEVRYASGGTNRTIHRTASETQVITITPSYGSN